MLSAISEWLFDSSGLTAHGFCLLWEPGLIWTYAIADTAIAVAYFSIPVALVVIARRRRDLLVRPLLWLFAAFILLCGTTHWLDLATLWSPLYGLQAVIKAATAVVSVFTAAVLWRVLPNVLALPSVEQLREANAALLASREQLFQSQKMEAVGQLTGGIAHDFNNLLQVITGSLGMMERRIAQARFTDIPRFANAIRQASYTGTRLTSRLLAFSRRQSLQPRAFEPDKLVSSVEGMILHVLGPEVRLVLNLGDGLWNAVCDPNQLESALLNLSINARDAMPNGGTLTITIADRRLSAEQLGDLDAQPGNYVEIEIKDDGEGMSNDTLNRAFEPFFTTKPAGQGTGLGLSQVYGFVKQSGGAIRLESCLGKGTSVRLFLPVAESVSERGPERVPEAQTAEDADLIEPRTVLLVEDQDDVRSQVAEALAENHFTVIEAADGIAGLKAVQSEERVDLLITDVGLSGMNGCKLAESARKRDGNLPIILITGYAGGALDTLELSEGVEVLRKPFTLDELVIRANALAGRPELVTPSTQCSPPPATASGGSSPG